MTSVGRQYPLPLPHREAMDADDFMVTDSNKDAVAWLDQWPQWPAHCLAIYGPSGSGKTHLAHVWQNKSKARALGVAELKENDASTLSAYKNVTLDDADKIAGDNEAEESLFHLYNRLREDRGFILLTALQAPAQWNVKLPDLRSRLLSVPAIALAAPDDDLLAGLLIKQFRDRQIEIGMDVINYLLSRAPRSPEEVRKLVTALDKASLAEGRGISIALARRLLEDQSFLLSS